MGIFYFYFLLILTFNHINPDLDNCPRPATSALEGVTAEDDSEKAFSRPLLTEPRSYFHFYITEERQPSKPKPEEQPNGHLSLVLEERTKMDVAECSFVSHFNIPNFVNLEQASALGEEDLVEPVVTLEKQACVQEVHCDTR
uniref:Uncharacterized protein n=1 Tax=Periophthalmus magnuspinnatus TaxID=409849 RepID=A0A3B4BDW4_9GOBI